MKQRQAGAEHVAVAQLQQRRRVNRPPEVLRVRAADAFRGAGGAGGVENEAEVARPDRRRRDRIAAARHGGYGGVAKTEIVFRADQPNGFDGEPARVQHRQIVGMDVLQHQQASAAIRQDVLKLRPPRGDVDWHRHRAKPGAAEQDFEELDSVGADDRDPVPGLDARAAQCGGEPGRGVAGVGIAPGRVADVDQRLFRVSFSLASQHRRQRSLGGREQAGPLRSQHRCRFRS